jgi:hypothetical protein
LGRTDASIAKFNTNFLRYQKQVSAWHRCNPELKIEAGAASSTERVSLHGEDSNYRENRDPTRPNRSSKRDCRGFGLHSSTGFPPIGGKGIFDTYCGGGATTVVVVVLEVGGGAISAPVVVVRRSMVVVVVGGGG